MSCGFETLTDTDELHSGRPWGDDSDYPWQFESDEDIDAGRSDVKPIESAHPSQQDWHPAFARPIKASRISQYDIAGLARLLSQLAELVRGDEFDDQGVLRPTEYSLVRFMEVLPPAWSLVCEQQITTGLPASFPRGNLTTDENGGIRVEWRAPNATVHLVLGSSKSSESYIYHSRGDDYAADKIISARRLARWLRTVEAP